LGAIFVLFGFFTRSSPYSSFVVVIGIGLGAGIMLLGLVQYIRGRSQAHQHYVAAQLNPTPIQIFGREGIYHQVTGFTSLRRLRRAYILSPNSGDRFQQATYAYWNKVYGSNNLPFLRFHVRRARSYTDAVITTPIPQRYEASTQQLVQRYVTELGLRQ
jgi:hypothetical protein